MVILKKLFLFVVFLGLLLPGSPAFA